MIRELKYLMVFILFLLIQKSFSQPVVKENSENKLSFEEFLGYVKKHHPLIKQAQLTLGIGEANALKARGGFDPKIEVDYDRKKFKNTEYYDQLNATFKIPTWYGVEFKANFEENTGQFLNPNLSVPAGGLYSAGISFSVAQGFLINERMAALKKARFFNKQVKADRDLLVNNLIFEASKAYFKWLKASNEQLIYSNFLDNARNRFKAVKRSVEVGDKAAIDSIEAKITLQNRKLNLEAATLKLRKAALFASNYLWLNEIPLELEAGVQPVKPDIKSLETLLLSSGIEDVSAVLDKHPKLLSYEAKINSLEIDKKLKKNKLLPKIDLQYNFLTPEIDQFTAFNTANYKAFANFSFPIFLRKERGDLRLATLKLQDVNFERTAALLSISNKVTGANAAIASLSKQNAIISEVVKNYKTLVQAEERKFDFGESSLFLINTREQKLIDAQLKANELAVKQLTALTKLFNATGQANF